MDDKEYEERKEAEIRKITARVMREREDAEQKRIDRERSTILFHIKVSDHKIAVAALVISIVAIVFSAISLFF